MTPVIRRGVFVFALALSHVAAAQSPPRGGIASPTSPSQIDKTFDAWDTNHDKTLSLEEFRAGARGTEAALAMRRLQMQFKAVDKNHDGFIDAEEYKALLLVQRAGAAAPALSAFDANKDQKLDFVEYTSLVRSLASQPAPAPAKP
jgi:hypothetical protein